MSTNRRRRAFTMLELMITLIIGSIVMISIYYGVVYFFGQISRAEARASLRREADVGSRWIELGVREGTWAYLPSDSADSVVAENYENGTLQWQKTVSASGSDLLVDSGGSQEEVISHLASLNFDVHSGRVAYSLQVEEGGHQYSLSSAVRLRNPAYSGVWHFSETGGRIAYDGSPKRNHALIHGCSYVTPSESDWEYGPVLSFDGAGDYLEVPANPGLDSSSRLVFSAWVRLSSAAASDISGSGTLSIINRNGESTGPGGFFHVYMEAGELCFAFLDTGGATERAFSGVHSWEADRWYELMVQYRQQNGTQWVRFYRDGDLLGAASVSEMQPVTAGKLLIGAYEDAGTLEGMWDGEMDEIRYGTF